MTNGTLSASQLQEEQTALLARIQEEPSTAQVIEALERVQEQFPAMFAVPTPATRYSAGANYKRIVAMPGRRDILAQFKQSADQDNGQPNNDAIRRDYVTKLAQLTGRNTIINARDTLI